MSWARSVGPTDTSPWAIRASSSSQERGAGTPGTATGAGTVVSVTAVNVRSPLLPSAASRFTSKLLQSSRPSSNSEAVSVTSLPGWSERLADTDTAYSMREGSQASAGGGAGCANSVSYQATQAVAACWTSTRSPGAMASAGSMTSWAAPLPRNAG